MHMGVFVHVTATNSKLSKNLICFLLHNYKSFYQNSIGVIYLSSNFEIFLDQKENLMTNAKDFDDDEQDTNLQWKNTPRV